MKLEAPPAENELTGRFTDWWPPLLVVMLLGLIWATMIGRADTDSERVIQDAMVNHRNVALAIMNHTDRLLNRMRFYGDTLVGNAPPKVTRQWIKAALERDKPFLRLVHFDASGMLLFTTGRQPEPWLLEEARRFAMTSTADADTPFVVGTVPEQEFSQAWNLPIFYRPPFDNVHHGFIAALIDSGDFSVSFGSIALGPSGEISLITRDGRELLRMREGRLERPESLFGSQRLHDAFSKDSGTLSEKVDYSDERLYAFHRIGATPLAVMVSRTRADVLQESRAIQRRHYGSTLLLSALMLGLTTLWMIAAYRRRQLIRNLSVAQEGNQRLIKQIEKEKETAYRLASHDKLTGLPNRLLFADLAARHARRARRTRERFAILFVDLDRFKPINDTYGHKAGDQLLSEVARRLQECVRQTDVISRHGGDEFIALVGGLHSAQDAARVANTIIDQISQPYADIVEAALRVSPSIGIALYPDDALEIEALIRQADTAMYQAKEMGRATFAFADPELNRRTELRNQIEAALPGAIANREIRLHYQPKVSLSDFRLTGLEALARWEHPQLGVISPGDFIAVAEECGAIVELGEWVISEVGRQLQQWAEAGVPCVPVAVNVSPRQLRSPQLYEHIMQTLAGAGIPPDLLEVEVTETGLVETGNGFAETLFKLHAGGVRIAIDDFGTGYSGLSQLRALPLSYVKIDKSFIRDIRNEANDAAIVSNTISLSHNLKLQTIAEGVETMEQVAHLKAARCDQAQGFLFSRPLPPAKLAPLLRQGRIDFAMPQQPE